MTSTLATFATLFDDRVRDVGSKISAEARTRAIAAAVVRHSQTRPLVAVVDFPGNGSAYDFDLPIDWVAGFSSVPDSKLEYPAGERVPTYLTREDWQFYQTPTAIKLRLLTVTPQTGKTLRMTYTKPHIVDAVSSTISTVDEGALADLAAAIGLRELAAYYANTQDPTIQADVVNYRSKADEYMRLAKDLEANYRKHFGLDKDSEARPGSAFSDDDQPASHRLGKLTHPNETR